MRDRLIGDRYRLEERVGAGGMGEVWRATDLELGRQVALKRSQHGDQGQIRREARIGAGLQHPNVVTVYDAVLDGDDRWLVMEYLPSRSLAAIIDTEGALAPSQVARIGAQLAGAMAAMHAKGMVHRDIKPGNVLVADDGTAKLTDLGIAQWSEVTHTGSGQVAGTPGYVAPEVADGHPARPASDVFSLGATLFAAVEGVSPWDGTDGPFAQLRRAAAFDVRPPRKAGALAPVLAELMHKQPAARPTAAQAKRLLAGDTTPPVRRPRIPRRAAVTAAIAVTVIALVAGVVYGLSGNSVTADTTGDPRTADPCSLLDPAWLGEFGKVEVDRNFGNFNTCGLMVQQSDNPDDVVNVRVEVRTTDEAPPVPPEPGHLPMPERPRENDGQCNRTISLPDSNETVVTARHLHNWHALLCAMADQVTKNMLPILNSGQIPRRTTPFPANSLALVNACDLVHVEDAAQVLGTAKLIPEPAFANWECYLNQELLEVAVLYAREHWPFGPSEGQLVRAGAHDIYVELGQGGWKDACQAEIVHRHFTGAGLEWVETVEIYLTRKGTTTPQDLCEPVTRLAQAAAARLPQP
jgi:hypothetical protein